MSSGFVSGGADYKPSDGDGEWQKAQKDIEDSRRARTEKGKQADGKSLYEVLQQNKAAKEDAFAESIKLKNQFRSLDDDEVEFLDTILETSRAKDKAVKEETAAQLELFRQQREAQQAAEEAKIDAEAGSPSDDTSWATSTKKRKRTKERDILKGVKFRKEASSESYSTGLQETTVPMTIVDTKKLEGNPSTDSLHANVEANQGLLGGSKKDSPSSSHDVKKPTPVSGLGLDAYGSDSDD